MNMFRCLLALLFALLLNAAQAQEFAKIPSLTARVTDTVGMLNAEQRAALENVLQEYETRTGSQIAVLLISSTAPEAIEQYGIRVADTWKIGRKGIDDGVILIVAKDNPKALRRLRIEAGRGVQGVLTDAKSKRILQDVIAPHFRQNDFYGGLVAGVSAITNLLDQEKFAPPSERKEAAADELDFSDLLPFIVFLIAAIVMMSRVRRAHRAFSDDEWGRAAGIILGSAIGSHYGHRRHHGFGGFGSSGHSGGFGGSGGFSGGGGTFDGGGASGDW